MKTAISPAMRKKPSQDNIPTTWRITIGIWSCVIYPCYMHLALLGGQYAAELLLLPPGHPQHHAETAWRTPYALLNVQNPADATAQDIRDAFRRLATTMHPDKRPWDPDATEAYLRLQEAFEMLRGPVRRCNRYTLHWQGLLGTSPSKWWRRCQECVVIKEAKRERERKEDVDQEEGEDDDGRALCLVFVDVVTYEDVVQGDTGAQVYVPKALQPYVSKAANGLSNAMMVSRRAMLVGAGDIAVWICGVLNWRLCLDGPLSFLYTN